MFNAQNISLSFGDRQVLDGVTLTLLPNERVALVGQNGAGKSSLLTILASLKADQGSIEVSAKARVALLKQTPELNKELTVLQAVREGLSELLAALDEHQKLCDEMASLTDPSEIEKKSKKINELANLIEHKGGFDVDYRIEKVLSRLGVASREQQIKNLSGGEARRVDLAKILLQAPDIYLLDEPTNHLDLEGIKFLVETFTKSNSAVLFISHDRAFTDEIATRIIELEKGKLYTHEPPYANYLENKLVRELIDARSLHRRERLLVGELAWLRAGTPARTTKQNARIERAYSMIDQVAKDNEIQRAKRLQIDRTRATRLGGTIIELDHVGAAFGDRVLFRDVNLKVTQGERYGILGANGCGKTTLLSIITGNMAPTFGKVTIGKNTTTLRFDQHREILDPSASLKETLADNGDFVTIGTKSMHIASYLEKYLFSPNDANRRVETLSGGEQNRLMIAKLFRHSANCLVLDEPTNDLDGESLAVLEELLFDYEGVVFCVSHDRSFLDRICSTMIVFEPKENGESHVEICVGNYSNYLAFKAQQEIVTKMAPKENKPLVQKAKSKTSEKRTFKEERELEQMQEKIEGLESELSTLHEELSSGDLFRTEPTRVQTKIERSSFLEKEIQHLYERWQELMDKDGR